MLGRKRQVKKEEEAKSKVETILGTGTKLNGDIYTKGSLRIEGEVEGHIKADGDLFIGEEGKVRTEVEARNVVVAGQLKGNVVSRHRIEILPTGKIEGDIQTKTLKIEEGAVFNGSSKPFKDAAKQGNVPHKEIDKARQEAAAAKRKN